MDLTPFVRIRTWWSDDALPSETDLMEEWFATRFVLGTYAYAPRSSAFQRFVPDLMARDVPLWTPLQRRPVRAILFDRVWLPAGADWGPVQ